VASVSSPRLPSSVNKPLIGLIEKQKVVPSSTTEEPKASKKRAKKTRKMVTHILISVGGRTVCLLEVVLRMLRVDPSKGYPYIKTIKIPRNHGIGGALGALIDALYASGFVVYIQFYTGQLDVLGLLRWLTLIHQDGSTAHGEIH